MNTLDNFLRDLKGKNLDLSVVYDIGACVGNWSTHYKSILPDSRFVLFEANPFYCQFLQNTGFEFYQTALSNPGRGNVEFFNGNNTGDSYYKETTGWYDHQSSITLETKTLDQIVDHYKLPIPNFIKIDTQGSELDILSGASFLDRVNLIYTECPIICYNKGAPNINDYLDFFKQRNFIPIDIFEIHRAEDTLLQIDIMFMNASAKNQFLSLNERIRPLI